MHYDEIEGHKIEMGCDKPLILDKMFGPTIFAEIRITAIIERDGWVIERLMDRGWVEICVLPAQIDADFSIDSLEENTD